VKFFLFMSRLQFDIVIIAHRIDNAVREDFDLEKTVTYYTPWRIRCQVAAKSRLCGLQFIELLFYKSSDLCYTISRPWEKNVLERYYLCERVEAWTGTDYARIGKRPKWYMCDTGLMSAFLNWRIKDIELDSDKSGKFVETLVFTELAAQVDLSSEYSLYQYRDIDKREIDFIIENQDGDLAGIEVKAGSGVGKDDFKHLAWFRDNLAKGRMFVGIVVYTGRQTLSFGNGMLAVPISAFWS